MSHTDDRAVVRIASCACRALRVSATGQPRIVNACACLACQNRTGSAFSYTAFFPDTAVEIPRGFRSWRAVRDAGRWHEVFFCPECGVTVFSRLEVFPDLIGISIGCFGDPAFERPHGYYWASQRHHWVLLPDGVPISETQ
jgi:hypothetical protein